MEGVKAKEEESDMNNESDDNYEWKERSQVEHNINHSNEAKSTRRRSSTARK